MSLEVNTCNLCGSTEHTVRFFKPPYTRVQCSQCGLVWSKEQPSFADLEQMYGSGYFEGETYLNYIQDQPVLENVARNRLDKLHQYVTPPGRVLDVGCAAGFFLNVCQAAGWDCQGIELSAFASSFARETLGLEVLTGTLDTVGSLEPAKLITLWDVIEHVPDPMATLSQAAELLETDGLLVISTGDIESFISRLLKARWRLITYDHLFYFSPDTLTQYLDKVGLEVVKIDYPGKAINPTLIAHMLLNHYLPLPFLRSPLISIAKLLPSIKLNLWDVMTIYARKR